MKYIKLFEEFDPFSHLELDDSDYDLNQEEREILKFNVEGNEKLKYPYFSLPTNITCPGALACRTNMYNKEKNKIQNFGEFTCYAQNIENIYPHTKKRNQYNYNLLLKCHTEEELTNLIDYSFKVTFPIKPRIFRIHESGDFYNQMYFDAWVNVAKLNPKTIFYAYTKSLKFWVARLNEIPNNLRLVASVGGKYDDLIEKYHLKYCVVVSSVEEATEKELKIDVDDRLASSSSQEPFALLLHGTQTKESGLNKQSMKNTAIVKDVKKRMMM